METQKSNRFKKAFAILLAVLFVVSLTAIATSAAPSCKGPIPDCKKGYHLSCVNGHWKCVYGGCTGLPPKCSYGKYSVCVNGNWNCVPCPGPEPDCDGILRCVNGQWICKPIGCSGLAPKCPSGYVAECLGVHWKCVPEGEGGGFPI